MFLKKINPFLEELLQITNFKAMIAKDRARQTEIHTNGNSFLQTHSTQVFFLALTCSNI